jgi:hypothetical protein
MKNKLPNTHKKANKARCDKRRNRQRKQLKAKTKLKMGCCTDGCWYNGKNMPYSNPSTLVWRIKRGNETWFPPKYLQLTSSELAKRLSILSDEHFLYYFKELGECICRNCLSEEQWQDQMLDAIEEKEAA